MIYLICSIFFETFQGLNFYWSPILKALLEMEKKNTKNTTKCS